MRHAVVVEYALHDGRDSTCAIGDGVLLGKSGLFGPKMELSVEREVEAEGASGA